MTSFANARLRFFALAIAVVTGGQLIGAELRTTAGDRSIRRTSATAPVAEAIPQRYVDAPIMEGGDCCSGCGVPNCGTCNSCCIQSNGTWLTLDYLLGWRHSARMAPIVTTSPNGTPAAVAGVLGQPTTSIAYPADPVGEDSRPGGRIGFGAWLDPWHCWGAEIRYFMLADEKTNLNFTSNGDTILARPFFDVIGNAQASRLLALPGAVVPGSVSVITESEVQGADALIRRALMRSDCADVDLLVGYQFSRIDESLIINDLSTDADPNNLIPDGTTLAINDSFVTTNEYHAAVIGAAAKFERGAFRFDLLGKIGLGNMRERVRISGRTVTDVPPIGTPDNVQNFGLLAQGVNIGTFNQDQFTVSPELNAKLVYHVSECVDVTAGYTFIYWSNLAQPGRQIDPDLQVPTGAFNIRDSEFWVHAITLGTEIRF